MDLDDVISILEELLEAVKVKQPEDMIEMISGAIDDIESTTED